MRNLYIIISLCVMLSCSDDDNNITEEDNDTTIGRVEWSDIGCEEMLSVNPDLPYICLEWHEASNAEEYIIYYSDSLDGEYAELVRTTELSYQNTELEADTVFFFYVVASGSEGMGERSSKKQRKRINALEKVRLLSGTGETGGCIGILSYSGYPEDICLDWEGGGEFAEEFVIYYSDTENGNFSEIARTVENSYQITDLEYGKAHYFYVVANSSAYGSGPKSDTAKTYRSQKISSTEFLEISEGQIVDFDISSTRIYVLSRTGVEKNLEVFDLVSGNFISSFTNPVFNSSNRLLVSSNEGVYIVDNQKKLISKFDIASNQVTGQLTSDVIIDNVDVNKSENQIYLTKEDGDVIEVYDGEFEPVLEVPLSIGYQKSRKFIVGNDGKIYVSAVDGVDQSGNDIYVLEVVTKEGTISNSFVSYPWSRSEYPVIDSSGSLYRGLPGIYSNVFLYRYEFVNNTWEFYTNFGDLPETDSVFEIDADNNVYKARTDTGTILYKLQTTE